MSSWRMNGLWRRMAGALMLCALLLSNSRPKHNHLSISLNPHGRDKVTCQETNAPNSSLITSSSTTTATGFVNTSASTPSVFSTSGSVHNQAPGSKPDSKDVGANLNTAVPDKKVNESSKQEMNTVKNEATSSGSSVFVGVLVTGLLAALAITVGYFKCQRRSGPKEVKLAEEAYPVDQENQGNTLVSVAPLNPPSETQEKPSINGESTEPAKTEPPPPPTNGHSTTKTADTEL